MGDTLAAVNAAYAEFETKYPEAANYFCFLAGFNVGHELGSSDTEQSNHKVDRRESEKHA